ncbi:hypothetical protein CFAM422_005726 [Trichoderma lentiforme]|uniref:Uncharacterized protein n=1 Tax=Trichoderma lentiforme TaxID=1567552 RepID=A0A9P4XF89_9HYPO|nr:hypothetical protein CFAM422_005726 [Trichoderma lentiforme]
MAAGFAVQAAAQPSAMPRGEATGFWELVASSPTLETLTAPFRSPLRRRAGRKDDLANIIGKL